MKVKTSERLKEIMAERNLKQVDILNLLQPYLKKYDIRLAKNDLSQYVSGKVEPGQKRIFVLAKALNVSEAWLMGFDAEKDTLPSKLKSPTITDEYTTFPIIGEIAAGYDNIILEDWCGDTIQIPNEYMRGYEKVDFIVLRVKGQSMYPMYQDGDIVLVLKQSTVNKSGDIGAIIYENELVTLKKLEFVYGEDWLKLVPLNPEYEPKLIEGEELEHCKVIGIPKLLIREFN